MISLTTPRRSDLAGCTVEELRRCLSESKRARAALDAVDVEIVALLEASLTAVGPHERGIPEIELVAHAGMTRREANDAVRRAHVIDDAPIVGDALAIGDVTAGHVDALARAMRIAGDAKSAFIGLVPDLLRDTHGMTVPEFAVEVVKAAKGVVTDGGVGLFEHQRRSTFLKMWNDADGMVNVRGMFDPETGAVLQARLHAQVEFMFHSGDRHVDIEHHPWVEPNDHRRAHALIALVAQDHDECTRVGGRSHGSRTGGSCRSDVIVHIDLETLISGLSESSTHRTAFGADLSVETIRRMSCDANIIPLVLNGAGMPLDIGRGQRLASAAQRRALEAAHDTCAFDGCAVRFHACQIHHIDYWERGGPTDMNNMVPLCSRHHHAAHEGGWRLRLRSGTRTLDVEPPGS